MILFIEKMGVNSNINASNYIFKLLLTMLTDPTKLR